MGDDTGSFRFIGLLNQTNQPHDHPFPDLELDEADMFYSSTVDYSYSYHYESLPSVDHNHYALTHQRFGLSDLLADEEAEPMATEPQPVPCFAHTIRGVPHQSAPQAVPTWHSRTGYSWDSEERREDDEVFSQESELVPPHVMVARSHASSDFSVLEGAGRTLKGRDLRRVRNAVWQKTGFLDL
jgi:Senescence regulator